LLRSYQAIAARSRHRAEPEARRRQAQGLPGQPARRPRVTNQTFSHAPAPCVRNTRRRVHSAPTT
jgi:hypothetical protein